MKEKNNILTKQRKKIEEINLKILKLVSERNKISKKIGDYKKKNKIPITNKRIEKKIFSEIYKKAEKLGLNKKYVKNIFNLIIKESKRLQK